MGFADIDSKYKKSNISKLVLSLNSSSETKANAEKTSKLKSDTRIVLGYRFKYYDINTSSYKIFDIPINLIKTLDIYSKLQKCDDDLDTLIMKKCGDKYVTVDEEKQIKARENAGEVTTDAIYKEITGHTISDIKLQDCIKHTFRIQLASFVCG